MNITKFFRIDQISVYYLSHQHWQYHDCGYIHLDAEVTPDGAGGGVGGVGGAEHHAAGLDSVETLPDHSEHGTTAREEGRDKSKVLTGQCIVTLNCKDQRGQVNYHKTT